MSRAVRAFLVWVMVFAMPLQGLAASMMFACGPSHERMLRGLAEASAHDHAAAGHGHGAHAGHAGHAGHASADMAHDESGGPAAPPMDLTCSACAACCSLLALPMSFSLPAATGMAHTLHTVPLAPRPSHQPEGLDRPPRSTSA